MERLFKVRGYRGCLENFNTDLIIACRKSGGYFSPVHKAYARVRHLGQLAFGTPRWEKEELKEVLKSRQLAFGTPRWRGVVRTRQSGMEIIIMLEDHRVRKVEIKERIKELIERGLRMMKEHRIIVDYDSVYEVVSGLHGSNQKRNAKLRQRVRGGKKK